MSKERICTVCGKEYDYCPSCPQYDYLPRWMYLFHDENCHDIYETLNEYGAKHISKEEAISRLKNLDTSVVKGNFKKQVDKLLVEDTIAKQKNRNKKIRAYVDSDQDLKDKEDTI